MLYSVLIETEYFQWSGMKVWLEFFTVSRIINTFLAIIVMASFAMWSSNAHLANAESLAPHQALAFSSLAPVTFSALNDPRQFERDIWRVKGELIAGVSDNLSFLASQSGAKAYFSDLKQERASLSRERVYASLLRFKRLLEESESAKILRLALRQEFDLYQSVGSDGEGTVKFTGYFQPIYSASRIATKEFKYPVFRKPLHFTSWELPHPTRIELEGVDGRGMQGTILHGYELAWLKNRFEAYMIHVQGSAILQYEDGTQTAIGFDAGTSYPFVGVGAEFLKTHRVAWGNLPQFFAKRPALLDTVLARNNRFIFFKELSGSEPIGSLGVPVIKGRSIATDKTLFPPGALGLIRTYMPEKAPNGEYRLTLGSRFVLDQDTGSAIKGPGRVDLFMGTGDKAQREANMMYSQGELYYLLLKG